MKYLRVEPHPVRRLLSEDEKWSALMEMPVVDRRDARLVPFCADCRGPVVVNKRGRYQHVGVAR